MAPDTNSSDISLSMTSILVHVDGACASDRNWLFIDHMISFLRVFMSEFMPPSGCYAG